jgi:hypothetical protein
MARQSFISNLSGYALKKLKLLVNGNTHEYDTTQPVEVAINSAPKFWYWDANGNNNSEWSYIGDGYNQEAHLIPNFADITNSHIKTNFTQNDPEAYPRAENSPWIILKKGLWRYTLLIDLERVSAGTGISDMTITARAASEGIANYLLIRPILTPTNNGIETAYTRQISGLFYSDANPIKLDGEYLVERNLRFTINCGSIDAAYRFRQSSLMLEQLTV